jgi:molybdate transport system ATP-binding protein
VAVARALAAEPQVLLLDEPMSALDVTAAPALRRLLREILRGKRRTAIIVTHDLLDALAIADKVVVFERGRVVESGPVRTVLASPRSDFAARIAGVNLIPGAVTDPGTIRTAWGTAISGIGDLDLGDAAVASPRNVIAVTIAEIDLHGTVVRVRGADQPDGSTGLAADITAASAADLDLAPGQTVYFVVKAQEVELHPALPVRT